MIVIIGAGLAGLSTAYHLGSRPHVVLEAGAEPGGLCRSRTVGGFVFDYTGHLLHLRDPRAVELVDRLMPGVFREVVREARIRTRGVTLPFPFQANLHGLPPEVVAECVIGFVRSLDRPVPEDPGASFREWSLAVFGSGISEAFLLPYGTKLFRRDPEEMTADWVGWSVPKPTLDEVVRGALGIENRGMGYNPTFRYPKRGGIEVVPRAFARRVRNVRFRSRVVSVDVRAREVHLEDGQRVAYEHLVVTSPLPSLLRMLHGAPDDLRGSAEHLDWSVVGCLNLGVDRPGIAGGAHWIYFPDADAPFYRVGFPSNFSQGVAPEGTSSMYVEFGLRRGEEPEPEERERSAVAALRREGILEAGDRIVARDWVTISPGYVIFDRRRQRVMNRVVPVLEKSGIHLAGRYGAWTYSYMERAMLDGLELAERLGGNGEAGGR